MSETSKTLQWLQNELAAVNNELNAVEVARTTYLASYETAKERLTEGREQLMELIADQD